MGALEFLKTSEALVGLILTLFAAVSGVVFWVQKQGKKSADTAFSRFSHQQETGNKRLEHIEEQFGEMKVAVRGLDNRLGVAERKLERVAEAKDVAAVQAEVSEMKGMLKQQTGMMDTLYEAALRASTDK